MRPLTEPSPLPKLPDRSSEFGAYRGFSIMIDPEPFAPEARATDMGRAGVPACVGLYPLRAIAERGLRTLVERHFRASVSGELPAAVLETNPQFLSVRKDGETARVAIKLSIRLVRQNESKSVLLSKIYTGERTGPWINDMVPRSLYEAFDGIWSAFLDDVIKTVPPSSFEPDGKDAREPPAPVLGDLFFDASPEPGGDVAGHCSVACNGLEAAETGAWARRRIRSLCADHLGIEEDRVGIRYDDKKTYYDEKSKTWTFAFLAWARTRMLLRYDPSTRRGRAVVDLGLFKGTAEEASLAAKEYIVREMNLRAKTYADDEPPAVADIRFEKIKTDRARNELILPFSLPY